MNLIKYLFFLLLAIFPLGQLGRLPFGEGEIIYHLNDIAAGVLVGSWVFWHLVKRKKFPLTPLFRPIILFFGLAVFSFLINSLIWGLNLAASLYLLRWIAYAGLYFLVFELVSQKLIKTELVLKGLISVGMAVGGLGILQYFLYPNLRNLYYLSWDPHYFRVFSTFFDPTFTGMILVLTLIAMAGYFGELRKKQWWFWGSVLVVYMAFALTYSRGSYLAFLTGAGALAYLKKAPKIFLITVLIFVLTLLILPKKEDRIGSDLARQETMIARIINWTQSLTIIKDQPIFGVGFNNYRQAQLKYGFLKEKEWVSHAGAGADSSLLFVWATTGIFGLLAYLWLGWRMIKLTIYNLQFTINLVLLSSIVALFFHSFFANSLFYPWITEWIWILAALVSVEKL